MSSGSFQLGWLGVCEHGSVDDVGEFAFEEPDGFPFGGSGLEASFDERLSVGVDPHLGDGDAVEGGVGLTVPSSVEPVSGVVC
jgi:hypothetical protein